MKAHHVPTHREEPATPVYRHSVSTYPFMHICVYEQTHTHAQW